MKKTIEVYLSGWTSEDICDSCKHFELTFSQEPCRSCTISGWERKED